MEDPRRWAGVSGHPPQWGRDLLPSVPHPHQVRGPSPRFGLWAPSPPTGNTGVAGGDARQGRLLSELLEELILVGEPGAGGGRSHGGVWAVRRWQRDGRHANRRGFPGLAPPRCHPGPPSLSLSESSSPARECAQGRGAGRGGQTNPRRPRSLLLLLLPPRPRGRVLQKGVEGGPAGGVTADTEARTAARRSARVGGRAASESIEPTGCSCGRRRRWWPALPTGPQGWEPARRRSALGSGGRSWRPQLLPGASSRLSPPREAPSSPALHLPLATPAESLRAALPQPSREIAGRGCAERRESALRGRGAPGCRSDPRGVGKMRDVSRPATQPRCRGSRGRDAAAASGRGWRLLLPRPGSHVPPRLQRCQPRPPLLCAPLPLS